MGSIWCNQKSCIKGAAQARQIITLLTHTCLEFPLKSIWITWEGPGGGGGGGGGMNCKICEREFQFNSYSQFSFKYFPESDLILLLLTMGMYWLRHLK